jgi:hypothetical protein
MESGCNAHGSTKPAEAPKGLVTVTAAGSDTESDAGTTAEICQGLTYDAVKGAPPFHLIAEPATKSLPVRVNS